MPDNDAFALLQQQYRQRHMHPDWQDFRKWRREWVKVEHRHTHEDLKLLLDQYGIDADIQSPLLEAEHADIVAIMRGNDAKIDMLSLDGGDKKKENVEDMRIYAAGRHLQEDEGQDFTTEIYEDIVFPYGVSVHFKTWNMPDDPKDVDRENDEEDEDYEKRNGKARDDYYSEHDGSGCFSREYVNPLEMSWFPYRQPDWFMQVSEIPYMEARELKQNRKLDKPFRILKDSGDFIFGDTTTEEELDADGWGAGTGPKLRRIRRAQRDKDKDCWKVTEWITEAGSDPNTLSRGEVLDEYDVPFKDHSPYFICASGNSFKNKGTPHLMYRPLLYKLMVKVLELNTWDSLLAKATIWRLQHPYMFTLNGTDPENVNRWVEGMKSAGFGVDEGVGAEMSFWVRPPQLAAGDIATAPNIQTIPADDIATLLTKREHVLVEINELRANRFLLGEGDVEGPPATSLLDQHQAAKTPFGPQYTNVALKLKEWREAEFNAICYWDQGTDGEYKKMQRPYRYPVRGDEPTGEYIKPRDQGDVVEITAEKIKAQRYIMSVTIANDTDAERAMDEDRADVAYFDRRALTQEQWLKRRGWDDPKKQARELEKERRRQVAQPFFDQQHMADVQRLYSMMTGIDPMMLQQAAMVAPGGPQQQQQQPQAPETPGFGVFNGTAPLVEGAEGSTSPSGGPMG